MAFANAACDMEVSDGPDDGNEGVSLSLTVSLGVRVCDVGIGGMLVSTFGLLAFFSPSGSVLYDEWRDPVQVLQPHGLKTC